MQRQSRDTTHAQCSPAYVYMYIMHKVVVFLCKGTRGDVLPFISIALTLQKDGVNIVLVCAPSSIDCYLHQILLQQQHSDKGKIEICNLPEFNIFIKDTLDSKGSKNKDVEDCQRLHALKTEAEICLKASKEGDLIVFNLFSLEGQFIASHLHIPCLAMSPHLQMRSVPASFKSQLSATHPILYEKLQNNESGEEVGYAEVDHWMWRMFLDDYGSMSESLGLPILPFTVNHCGNLPQPTPLLYGISPSVISPQPWWPSSVKLCGFWTLPPDLYPPPGSEVTALLHSLPAQPLYVGFGSMESYLLDLNWSLLLTNLEEVLQAHAMYGLFQCKDGGPISKAYTKLSSKLMRISLLTQVVSHDWLFAQCCAVMHHGGSGTVATCLFASRPQIISPVMFDQTMWAEKLAWMGVAYQCPSPGKLTTQNMTQALKYVAGKTVQRTITDLREQLLCENAVKVAVDSIQKTLHRTSDKIESR